MSQSLSRRCAAKVTSGPPAADEGMEALIRAVRRWPRPCRSRLRPALRPCRMTSPAACVCCARSASGPGRICPSVRTGWSGRNRPGPAETHARDEALPVQPASPDFRW